MPSEHPDLAGGRCAPAPAVHRVGRRRLHVLLAPLLALAMLAAACSSDDEAATTTTADAVTQGAPLLVVDVEALSIEEQLSFAALQGIVNRDAPTLYLVGLRSAQDFEVDPSAEVWLRDVVDLDVERIEPDEALRRLLPRTKGLVIWDPAVPYESQDVATTIAGLEDLVPVDPAMAERLAADHPDVEVVRDLRDLELTTAADTIGWAIDNLTPEDGYPFPVWTGRPRNGKAIQPGLRDWAVMHRAFVFDADPAIEPALLDAVLSMFPPGTPIYGYPSFDNEIYRTTGLPLNEAVAAASVAAAGHWLVPTTDAANLSVHVQLGTSDATPAWDATPRTPDPDTTYVSFTVSDGDAMGYDQTLLRHLQLDALTDESVPLGISISPYLATDAPLIYDWIVENAPDQIRFVAGPSGGGYAYPYAMADLPGYLDHSREMLDRYGLAATWILEPPLTASPSAEVLTQFVQRLEPSLLLTDYGGSPPNPPTVSFVDGVPVVHTAMVANSGIDVAKVIRSIAEGQAPGPRFVSIGLTTWGTSVDDAQRAMDELGEGYEAVAPDALAGYLLGAYADGYRTSGEPDRVPTPPEPGACRATVIDLDGSGDPFASRFVARLLAGTPLPADVRLTANGSGGLTASFDTDLLAKAADDFAAAQFSLAYGPEAIESARITVALRDLTIAGTDLVAGGDLEMTTDAPPGIVEVTLAGTAPDTLHGAVLSAQLEVDATFDAGDADLEIHVSGPVACAAAG